MTTQITTEEPAGYAPAQVWPVYEQWREQEEWLEELVELLRSRGLRVQVVPGGVGRANTRKGAVAFCKPPFRGLGNL